MYVCSRLVVVWVVFGVFVLKGHFLVCLDFMRLEESFYTKKTIIQDLLTSLILQ